jgi:hypothetical protein
MPSENEKNKDHSKISLRIGDVQVELEGTQENIKKLMSQELYDFAKGLEGTTKQAPPPPPSTQKTVAKAPEAAPKEKTAPPPPPPSKPSATAEPAAQPPRVPTTGKKPEKTGKRKIAWRTAAIALVLVGIVLSAALVSVLAIYLPMVNDLESQAAEKDTEIATLNSGLTSLTAQVASLQANLTQSNSDLADLQSALSQYNDVIASYQEIIYLQKSGYLVSEFPVNDQNASDITVIWNDTVEYAGYITVDVESSSNTTYARVFYDASGTNFDYNVTVGTSGRGVFPVLPGEIALGIGNTELVDTVNATVTAIYYY